MDNAKNHQKSQLPKLIFINRYFYPDHSATSQMLSDLAFGLGKIQTGHKIHIVTSRQRYDNASAHLKTHEIVGNVEIHRIATTQFGRHNLIGRAVDYLSFYVSSFLVLVRITKKGDTLIAKTDPPLISLVAALVANLKQAYLINWLQDLFPEVAAQLGLKIARGVPYAVLKSLRNKTLNQAKTNVAIGELMAHRLRKEGIPESKITVIHNWANETQLRSIPHDKNSLRQAWGLQDKFVVGYSGNLGRSHDFSTILDAALKLKTYKNIVFLLIGAGAQLPLIQKACTNNDLTNVIFKPYQPQKKLSESLSAADIHLISLKPNLESLIVPSKFYGILAVGRPIIFIGANNGELANIINKHQCGYVVEQNNTDSLASIIKQQAKNTPSNDKSSQMRALFDRYYGKARAINQFSEVFK